MSMKMKIKMKAFKIYITIMITLLVTVPVFGASDIMGHPAEVTLTEWIEKGLLVKDRNGKVKPDDKITRAEFMALVNRAFKYMDKSVKIKNYIDVSPEDWFYDDVAIALYQGYISGTSPSKISPQNYMTNEEALSIAGRIAGVPNGALYSEWLYMMKDNKDISKWAKGIIANMVGNGIAVSKDGFIYPKDHITRAQTIDLLDRVLTGSRVFSFKGSFGNNATVKELDNVLINTDGITINNMTINGDLEVSYPVGNGEVYLKNVVVKGKMTITGVGVNSVHLENCDIRDLTVLKSYVSVFLTNDTFIKDCVVKSKFNIIDLSKGSNIAELTINETDNSIKVKDETIVGTITSNGELCNVYVEENSRIQVVKLNKQGTVTGKGEVGQVYINASDCYIEPDAELVMIYTYLESYNYSLRGKRFIFPTPDYMYTEEQTSKPYIEQLESDKKY